MIAVDLDLRDHVVLSAAVGLALPSSPDPLASGAVIVEQLSLAAEQHDPRHEAITAGEIVIAPRPFRLSTALGRRLYVAEARINLPTWISAVGEHDGDEVHATLVKVAALLGG